jgi:hypothetical protein
VFVEVILKILHIIPLDLKHSIEDLISPGELQKMGLLDSKYRRDRIMARMNGSGQGRAEMVAQQE